jgi:MutS-like protein
MSGMPGAPPPSLGHEYVARLSDRRATANRLARRHDLIGNARLLIFAIALVLALLAFWFKLLSPWCLFAPLVGFILLVAWHGRVGRWRQRAERAAAFYERGLARLDEQWQGMGEPGTRFLNAEHPYAADLDLFGSGSLFELLCTARTRGGEDLLAAWLLGPADAETIRARQAAVAELRDKLDLREDLAVLGEDIRAAIQPDTLAAWGREPRVLTSEWTRWTAYLLPLPTLAALCAWIGFETGPLPFVAMALVQAAFAAWLRPQVKKIVAEVEKSGRDLALLAAMLGRIEIEPAAAQRLRTLRQRLKLNGLTRRSVPPSQCIAQLGQLIDWLDAGRNQFFVPIALLLLWHTRLAFALEDWRGRCGPAIADWLAALSEFEALSALATYAAEHASDPFAVIADQGPIFEAQDLGHPLIPVAKCVRNDVSLGGDVHVLIVSGSNMSGKSTLLRTVGINAVIALAGGPVRARSLTISSLAIGATLRIQDSLQAGRSRFFSEVMRVRQIVELAKGPRPLLFLLDEIFHGTNSHDRRQGAEAIVRGLIDRGAMGLVTTHDLALAAIADHLGPRTANVHFADHMENGEMVFDYKMRPGVVQHSNALALMRAVGLEV